MPRPRLVPVTAARRLPEPVVRWRAERLVARRDAQLPEALERVASAVRAGRSLGAALGEAAAATRGALGDELGTTAAALAAGAPVEAAIQAWSASAAPSGDLELATTALALGARTGGEVARACDRVAATLRERRELRGEARALATQARASAGVLTAAPVAFAGLVSMIEPGVVGFLVTPAGLVCLGVGLGLDVAGAVWMARIVERAA